MDDLIKRLKNCGQPICDEAAEAIQYLQAENTMIDERRKGLERDIMEAQDIIEDLVRWSEGR